MDSLSRSNCPTNPCRRRGVVACLMDNVPPPPVDIPVTGGYSPSSIMPLDWRLSRLGHRCIFAAHWIKRYSLGKEEEKMNNQRQQEILDQEHLRLLSIFHYVRAGTTAFVACIPLIHVIVGMGMIIASQYVTTKPNDLSLAFIGWQKMAIVEIDGYACLVPYVDDEEGVFLKTIIPSRKATKKYLRGQK